MPIQPRSAAPRYPDEREAAGRPPSDGDPIHLGGGDDQYRGSSGSDTIYGGGGDDFIQAQSGDDKVNGGTGNDQLYGFNGSDFLIGGAGDDYLSGGKGRDYFYGGEGRDNLDLIGDGGSTDTILYRDVLESNPGDSHDIIDFFSADRDLIDLHRIDADTLTPDNDAFTWVGASAFSGTPGELRFDPDPDVSLLQGDVNGDGVADFEVYFITFSPLHLTVDTFNL